MTKENIAVLNLFGFTMELRVHEFHGEIMIPIMLGLDTITIKFDMGEILEDTDKQEKVLYHYNPKVQIFK